MPDETNQPKPPVNEPHLRIPNRLHEALLDSDMSDRQFRICHGLIRLTLGWSKQTAAVSVSDFAGACGQTYGGTFRDVLRELTTEGVIEVVWAGGGNATNSYRLNTDYTRWGRFSVSPERLRRRFGERPDHDDDLVRPPRNPAQPQADSQPIDGLTPARTQAGTLPVHGHGPSPYTGMVTPPKPSGTNELQARTDIDKQDIRTTTTTASSVDPENGGEKPLIPDDSTYALAITKAGNFGISKRWGEQTKPLYFGQAYELVADLKAQAVPISTAIAAIAAVCKTSKQPTPPRSVNYFRQAILDAHRSDAQRQLDGSMPSAPANAPADTILAHERSDVDLAKHYDAERQRAADSWLNDPANATAKRDIETQADLVANVFSPGGLRDRTRARQITIIAASKAGFPDLDTWAKARTSPQLSTPRRG